MYTLFQFPRIKFSGSRESCTAAYSRYITLRVDVSRKDFSEIREEETIVPHSANEYLIVEMGALYNFTPPLYVCIYSRTCTQLRYENAVGFVLFVNCADDVFMFAK